MLVMLCSPLGVPLCKYLSECSVIIRPLGLLPALHSMTLSLEMSADDDGSGTSTEPNSGVGPAVQLAIKDAISSSFTDLSTNLTSVIENRLASLKRDLSNEHKLSLSSAAKRAKTSEVEFRSKGNKKQYEHQQLVLDKLSEAKEALTSAKYEKAKDAIEEGISLSKKRIKVIKLADRNEFG